MQTVIERVPLERINAEAQEINLAKTLLTVLAGVLWLIGWVAGKIIGTVVVAITWSLAAVKVGWADARSRPAAGGG